MGSDVWRLDAVNSPELLARMRRHAYRFELDGLWVGEGWRALVAECHERLAAEFPDYELLNVKEKWGVLAYQAFPRAWVEGERRWTPEEHERLDLITDEFAVRSESTCEWCGSAARLRDGRDHGVTLCDPCDRALPDPVPRRASL